MDFKTLFDLFENKKPNIDETAFYFQTDPDKKEHFIGFIPHKEFPYWIGLCDIDGGSNFKTAKELFEAPVFDGKSIEDRWEEVVLTEMSGLSIDDWIKNNSEL